MDVLPATIVLIAFAIVIGGIVIFVVRKRTITRLLLNQRPLRSANFENCGMKEQSAEEEYEQARESIIDQTL